MVGKCVAGVWLLVATQTQPDHCFHRSHITAASTTTASAFHRRSHHRRRKQICRPHQPRPPLQPPSTSSSVTATVPPPPSPSPSSASATSLRCKHHHRSHHPFSPPPQLPDLRSAATTTVRHFPLHSSYHRPPFPPPLGRSWKGYSVRKGPKYAPKRIKEATDLTRENFHRFLYAMKY